MSKTNGGRKAPTTDPMCPNRLHHFSGNRCPKCGGVG